MTKISNTFLFVIIVLHIILSAGYVAYDLLSPAIIERTTVQLETEGVQESGYYIPGYGVSTTLGQRFVFAVSAKTCPPGSVDYTGPENLMSQDQGFIYCVLHRQTVTLDTERFPQCPEGYEEYKHPTYRPENGFIWCQLDFSSAENQTEQIQ